MTPPLIPRARTYWDKLIGIRYRSLAKIRDTWRTYSGLHPSSARAWVHVAQMVVAPKKRVLCYPSRPAPYSVLYKFCALAGYWITTDPEDDCDAVFVWDDATRSDVGPFGHGEAAINARCRDISKQRVSRVFEDVFGYGLQVDPTTYSGPRREKVGRERDARRRVRRVPDPGRGGGPRLRVPEGRRQPARGRRGVLRVSGPGLRGGHPRSVREVPAGRRSVQGVQRHGRSLARSPS